MQLFRFLSELANTGTRLRIFAITSNVTYSRRLPPQSRVHIAHRTWETFLPSTAISSLLSSRSWQAYRKSRAVFVIVFAEEWSYWRKQQLPGSKHVKIWKKLYQSRDQLCLFQLWSCLFSLALLYTCWLQCPDTHTHEASDGAEEEGSDCSTETLRVPQKLMVPLIVGD